MTQRLRRTNDTYCGYSVFYFEGLYVQIESLLEQYIENKEVESDHWNIIMQLKKYTHSINLVWLPHCSNSTTRQQQGNKFLRMKFRR